MDINGNEKVIGIDLGGTKLISALFDRNGNILDKINSKIEDRKGTEIGSLITSQLKNLLSRNQDVISIGVSVPGIYDSNEGTVWAPNLTGWKAYPLQNEINSIVKKDISVNIESDRSCYILGEVWKGNARDCKHAIFVAVGTGIGAGILVNGEVLRGYRNIAGAIGWMALNRIHLPEYRQYGCFEYHSSGEGLVRIAKKYLADDLGYQGTLKTNSDQPLSAKDIFSAFEEGDPIASRVIGEAIEYWGMATANLISIFNPEKIILGGGVFDSAAPLLDQIIKEAKKWAQPVAIKEVSIEFAGLGNEAGLYGAGYLALSSL